MHARNLQFGLGVAALLVVLALPWPLPGATSATGTKAPHFQVKDVAGRTLDLDSLRSQGPILLDFWATWCKPCVKSLPELQAWHEAYSPEGLTVIGVSVDGPRNRARVRPFAKRMGLEYPIVVDDDGRIQDLYQVLAIPTAVLIDTSGAIAHVRVAYRPGEGERFEQAIRAQLGLAAEAGGETDSSKAAPSEP